MWIDAFGDKKLAPRWMTLFLVTIPLGVLVGYLIAAFTVAKYGWRMSFYIQIVSFVPIIVGYLTRPNDYMNLEAGHRNKVITEESGPFEVEVS